jgi:TPR repeat protein
MLGLNQPGPSTDALREKAFSGLDSFLEPERPKGGGRRMLLMLALLAALGAAGWWTYTNLGTLASGKAKPALSSVSEDSAEKSAAAPTVAKPTIRDAAPTADAGSQQAAPSATVPEGQPENAGANSDSAPKSDKAATGKPVEQSKPPTPRVALGDKSAEKREPVAVSAASKMPALAEADTGDAAFRKGEAYLYGRGVPENCNDAVQYLKAASAKSNAKARSAFGTMYATGHCVARDLPTSYLWFAMALKVDPNNQILEKDLNAVWNQMTPPERQMATRMKQ